LARPRKSLQELKLSGTYAQNKKRYEARPDALTPAPVRPLGRAPSYLTKEERACWKEIAGSGADAVLSFGDRLALEVVSKLLAKSRREELKPSQLSSLSKQLEKLKSKGQQASAVVVDSTPKVDPLDVFEQFCAECEKEDTLDARVRQEMQRRREIGPQGNQTHQEWDRWCWWATVRDELGVLDLSNRS
jgi:hypothetical protein